MGGKIETLRELGEAGVLARIFARLPAAGAGVLVGPGDDAAALAASGDDAVVFAADAMAEGVHFEWGLMTPADVGWRLTCANLSDLAAMGAAPWAAVVTLAAPGATPAAVVEAFYEGAAELARREGLLLVGGDVVGSRAGVFFSMAILGKAPGGKVLTRGGARPGDVLMVTGEMGLSRAGLDILRGAGGNDEGLTGPAVERYRRPTPRVTLGRALAAGGIATAAIDTSDSLSESCAHLARMSDVGVALDAAALPIAAAARAVAAARGEEVFAYALGAGEDFELLFACPPSKVGAAAAAAKSAGVTVTAVGAAVEAARGLTLVREGKKIPLAVEGHVHF